jgi:hypothetical protein
MVVRVGFLQQIDCAPKANFPGGKQPVLFRCLKWVVGLHRSLLLSLFLISTHSLHSQPLNVKVVVDFKVVVSSKQLIDRTINKTIDINVKINLKYILLLL